MAPSKQSIKAAATAVPAQSSVIVLDTQASDQSTFGKLPPEIRNRIYQYVVLKPKPIRLPRKVHGSTSAMWHEDALYAANASEVPAFGVPKMAQTNKQFRHECLGIFYGENTFVLVYNAHTPQFELDSLTVLEAMVDIIGPSIKAIRPKALEIRFTYTLNINISSCLRLARSFGVMHNKGLTPATDKRIIKPTTAGEHLIDGAPIRTIVQHLFSLGIYLSGRRCKCEKHTKRVNIDGKLRTLRVRLFECESQSQCELERLIFCKKMRVSYFMLPEVHRFLTKLGLSRLTSGTCPDGCCLVPILPDWS